MTNRKEVEQLLTLFMDLLDSVESLRSNLYSSDEPFDEGEAYKGLKILEDLVIDIGNIAKDMDDQLTAKEIKDGFAENKE